MWFILIWFSYEYRWRSRTINRDIGSSVVALTVCVDWNEKDDLHRGDNLYWLLRRVATMNVDVANCDWNDCWIFSSFTFSLLLYRWVVGYDRPRVIGIILLQGRWWLSLSFVFVIWCCFSTVLVIEVKRLDILLFCCWTIRIYNIPHHFAFLED